MTWAKVDTALHRNPKVRMAGRTAREVFLFVVLQNAEQSADGVLPAMYVDPDFLADSLQCSKEDAIEGLKRCETFHLLHVTDTEVALVGWDSQWKTKTSTDRVRKHREKKKAKQKHSASSDVTLGNVSPVSRNVCNAPEKREKREKREDIGPRKRGTQLPHDWKPNEKHAEKAKTLGLGLEAEAEKFRDHALSKGRVLRDWDAGFRNWLTTSAEYRSQRGGSTSSNQRPMYEEL